MSDQAGPNHLAQCEKLLQEAEAYERAGDWENAVGKYRALNDFDHLYKGAEAKLLFALTERDAGRLYDAGKAHMAAGRFAEALEAFHKAKVRAGVYRDTSALIRECEQHLASAGITPLASPGVGRKGCLGAFTALLR